MGKTVCLCWIPSHIGIEGNELADAAAKAAAKRPEEPIFISHTDWRSIIRCALLSKWKQQWELCRDKLKEMKPIPVMWTGMEGCSRRDVVVNSRLRLGHTFLTHGYLMNNDVPDIVPIFELCNNAVMTVKYIMIECGQLTNVRRKYPRLWRPGIVTNIR